MEVTYDWGIIRCVFGFCAGMAVHRLLNGRPGLAAAARRRPTVMTLIELATVAGIGLFVHHAGTGRLSLLAPYVFALSVFVFALEGGAVSRALRSPLPVLVGTLSYSIYMIHWLIVKGVEHVVRAVDRITVTMMNPIVEMYGEPMRVWGPVPWQSDLIGLAVLLLVIAVSFVSYHTLERPARRAIRAWAEKRHGRRFAVEDPKGAP